MEQEFHKDFDKCPSCGSKERFFEEIVKKLREEGKVNPDWNFYLDMKQGVVVENQKMQLLPIGSEIPAYAFATDICLNCGCIYAVKLTLSKAKKTITPVTLMPNRAERRRMGKEVPFNNPAMS